MTSFDFDVCVFDVFFSLAEVVFLIFSLIRQKPSIFFFKLSFNGVLELVSFGFICLQASLSFLVDSRSVESLEAFFALGARQAVAELLHDWEQLQGSALDHGDGLLEDVVGDVADGTIFSHELSLHKLLVYFTLRVLSCSGTIAHTLRTGFLS